MPLSFDKDNILVPTLILKSDLLLSPTHVPRLFVVVASVVLVNECVPVTIWIRHPPTKPKIAGSSPVGDSRMRFFVVLLTI